jgi:hypothetical protein
MFASAPTIVFHDLDFIAPKGIYEAIAAEVRERNLAMDFRRFFCVPVAFLTSGATRDYLSGWRSQGDVDHHHEFGSRAAAGAGVTAMSIAYGSSCMVLNREHYLAIGGHDEAFWGHGAEDYEFLHRLSSYVPRGPKPPCYYTDFRDNSIRRYRGFRATFALHGIDVFQKGIFVVHLDHPSRPFKGYVQRRRNSRLLRRRMEEFDRAGRHPDPLPDKGRRQHQSGLREAGAVTAPGPMPLQSAAEPLDSPVFRPFGGKAAMERAIRIAALGAALSRNAEQMSGLRHVAALQLYSLLAAWRLPRRARLVLRWIPSRYTIRPEEWAERLLLAWSAATSRGRQGPPADGAGGDAG